MQNEQSVSLSLTGNTLLMVLHVQQLGFPQRGGREGQKGRERQRENRDGGEEEKNRDRKIEKQADRDKGRRTLGRHS